MANVIYLTVCLAIGYLFSRRKDEKKFCLIFFKDNKQEIEDALSEYHSYELSDSDELKKTIIYYLNSKNTESSKEIIAILDHHDVDYLIDICKKASIVLK